MTRFFGAIETPLAEGANSMPIELPDKRQARAILEAFGCACDRLTGPDGGPSAEEVRFIESAADQLAGPDGRVVPVRLSLFAEVARSLPWTLDTLNAFGGIAGIGVTFLRGAFDAPSAPPVHQTHRKAAQNILRALLSASPSNLRGAVRSASELRDAAGYRDQPADFAAIVRILDSGLRLISIVDVDGPAAPGSKPPEDGSGDPTPEPRYQLAHDYLVEPIRQWLEREQRTTRSGRARLRLASIAMVWGTGRAGGGSPR